MTNTNLRQLFAGALPIEVKQSISKALVALFISIVFFLLGIWGLATSRASQELFPYTLRVAEDMHLSNQGALYLQEAVEWLCIALSGSGSLLLLLPLFDRRPRILLSREGVWVRGWKGCPIAWKDIDRAWKVEQRPGALFFAAQGADSPTIEWVCIAIKNPNSFQKKQGKFKQKALAHYRSRGWGDMYFTTGGADIEADELIAAIQTHIGSAHLSQVESLSSASA